MSDRTVIHSDAAPQAIGPYSQAVRTHDTVWLSGQIPLDPLTMELVGPDVSAQAEQVFRNPAAVARAAGGDLEQFVKVNIYLTDLADFAAVNAVMARHFSEPFPARACVQVAALPRGAAIEVEATMVLEP